MQDFPPKPYYSTASTIVPPCSYSGRYCKIDNCLYADLYSHGQDILIWNEHNWKVPDSILMAVNLPRVYPYSKHCYQSQNIMPNSQVQQTAKPFTSKPPKVSMLNKICKKIKTKRKGKLKQSGRWMSNVPKSKGCINCRCQHNSLLEALCQRNLPPKLENNKWTVVVSTLAPNILLSKKLNKHHLWRWKIDLSTNATRIGISLCSHFPFGKELSVESKNKYGLPEVYSGQEYQINYGNKM